MQNFTFQHGGSAVLSDDDLCNITGGQVIFPWGKVAGRIAEAVWNSFLDNLDSFTDGVKDGYDSVH